MAIVWRTPGAAHSALTEGPLPNRDCRRATNNKNYFFLLYTSTQTAANSTSPLITCW